MPVRQSSVDRHTYAVADKSWLFEADDLTMWDVNSVDISSCVVFLLACVGVLGYCAMSFFVVTSIVYGKMTFHRPCKKSALGREVPGVSIIKPLMGVDALLEHNLESHFTMTYPKFELLLCFHDDQDAAIPVARKLQQKYPGVDAKLLIGGDTSIVNPMVQNMAPAYAKARYEYVWISSGRVEASDEIIYDLAGKLQPPGVSLVHQMPFTTDSPGFGSAVEKVYFGGQMSRFYIAFNCLDLPMVTGMSYMFKKALLDEAFGLAWYGRFLAEDFMLVRALHDRGRLMMSAIPARQNTGPVTLKAFVDRMVRWKRLRLNLSCVTYVLEPLSDCFPLGVYMGWAGWYFFQWNPVVFFCVHVLGYMVLDYIALTGVQNGPLVFSKGEYVKAWLVGELTLTLVYLLAVLDPHVIKWGRRTYRVKYGGLADVMQEGDDVKRKLL